ncbi:MAG: peptide deformylase [Bacteroidales bacterium]|nr:peptide deformylase [Candidatus Cacconaster merdequi]
MILPIYVYGSQVLRAKAEKVDSANEPDIKSFVEDMVATMHNADGCGLAAPQVGVSKRILVVDGNDLADRWPELKGFHREMINPEFTFESEETSTYEEGCLSVPGVDADVVRPKRIKVRYLDVDFNEVEEEFDNFAARMIQHEMDHLNGILFVDHASPIRKKMISGKLANIVKGKIKASYKVRSDAK